MDGYGCSETFHGMRPICQAIYSDENATTSYTTTADNNSTSTIAENIETTYNQTDSVSSERPTTRYNSTTSTATSAITSYKSTTASTPRSSTNTSFLTTIKMNTAKGKKELLYIFNVQGKVLVFLYMLYACFK